MFPNFERSVLVNDNAESQEFLYLKSLSIGMVEGNPLLCEGSFAGSAMARHLKSCKVRAEENNKLEVKALPRQRH